MVNMRLLILFHLFLHTHYVYTLENLALNKSVWEDRPWKGSESWGGANAVDGRYQDCSAHSGQCVISDNYVLTATWRVDLGGLVSISHINIYYRTDNLTRGYAKRMAGFFLYVSNTTSETERGAHLCFHDNGSSPTSTSDEQRIACSVYGRYVIYYNERKIGVSYPSHYSKYAYYELCELQVCGCSGGCTQSNQICTATCPQKCVTCAIKTRDCLVCEPGYYGKNCTGHCPPNCHSNICDINSGHCVNCPDGLYGEICNTSCPQNCEGRKCDITKGHCLLCVRGYQGSNCHQVCDKQKYGINCSQSCGNCSGGETCHHVNGTCVHGCDEGVQGDKCTTECSTGSYGKNCTNNCSENCMKHRVCDRFTGECEGGCKVGWKEKTCKTECDNGTYGDKCNKTCGHCLGERHVQCHHVSGSCTGGCSPGYNGTLCIDKCSKTYYGTNCAKTCSANCVNNTCEHDTGVCFALKQPQQQSNSGMFQVIGIIIAAAVVLVVIISILIVCKRKRNTIKRQKPPRIKQGSSGIPESNQKMVAFSPQNYKNTESEKGMKYEEIPTTSGVQWKDDDMDIDEKVHEENPYGDLYVNEATIPDIALKNLASMIEEKSRREDDGFKKEYATLPYGVGYPCDVGKLPENIPKNRFKTTFPYDHSRVVLLDPKQDYINANYIDGLTDERSYIAAQGPKQSTVPDFWQMVWQENVAQIVMLTNLKEGRKDKCVQYWPDFAKIMTYGNFTLRTEEEKHYAYHVIRKLKITHRQLNESRMITQYHYTAWPDHGTPDSICLLLFHNHVTRTKKLLRSGPIIVHCSAGIGRTGTYIAIDALSDIVRKNKKINIAEYVKKMRENRMNMVQTYEQYKTIFLTLHELVKANVKAENPRNFVQKLNTGHQDKPVNSSTLRKEFQKLLSLRPQYTETDYKIASQNGDSSSQILPLDECILFLTSSVPSRGNYINAISIPSFTNKTGYILTKNPAVKDAVDFLRLIVDHESKVVIFMDPMNTVESTSNWLPNPDKIISPFKTQLLSDQTGDVKCSKIQIFRENSNETWTVDVVEPSIDFDLDQSQSVSQILQLVTFAKNRVTEGQITVVSRDGAALCGVFCALYNAVQQLVIDNEVDVFSVVRQLQIKRPELCSTMQEYSMIHDALKSYIQSRDMQAGENVYCNQ